MRAYAILITQDNSMRYLMNKEFANMLKTYKAGVVMNGYDPVRFLSCLVFKTKAQRDKCAEELKKRGVNYITRDDAIIDDGYL